ncbi:hypothetical protein CBR_g38767 [Chara braunii]|uniref:Uncharacterized protein n=1 Tax=Chara braunii TaxID=69332 RepID=A0A388LQI9_CHABU|nr:hypothetical protein CBR_g38767 [Chara braunii]|eukprot:GBG84483.1 hypothetical protein CBR_g38767 [Chara braunii]
MVSPRVTERVDQHLKSVVDHNRQEVELLKETRLREDNARKESEKEVERLKDEIAKLQTSQKKGGTNPKRRMDAAAGASALKGKGVVVASPVVLTSHREAVLKAAQRDLRVIKKDAVTRICEEEGVSYTTLDSTKEAIAQARTYKAVADDEINKDLGKPDSVVEVTEDEDDSEKSGGCDSADS